MRIGQRMVKVTEKEGPRKVSALSERQAVSMPPELPATIADVRNDTSATNWCRAARRRRRRREHDGHELHHHHHLFLLHQPSPPPRTHRPAHALRG